ncbi:uncharacterized protein LOC144108316 [Amblyomma americanum]
MTVRFNELIASTCYCVTVKQVRQKMETLNQQYRKRVRCSTGSGAIQWPYFYRLHRFLGSLPCNDASLLEKSFQLEVVTEMSAAAQVAASSPEEAADATALDTEEEVFGNGSPSSACSRSDGPAATVNFRRTSRGEKRKKSSAFGRLMNAYEAESKRAALLSQEELKIARKANRLQKEANEIQRGILKVISKYFNNEDK